MNNILKKQLIEELYHLALLELEKQEYEETITVHTELWRLRKIVKLKEYDCRIELKRLDIKDIEHKLTLLK
jgi:hypothetical protein